MMLSSRNHSPLTRQIPANSGQACFPCDSTLDPRRRTRIFQRTVEEGGSREEKRDATEKEEKKKERRKKRTDVCEMSKAKHPLEIPSVYYTWPRAPLLLTTPREKRALQTPHARCRPHRGWHPAARESVREPKRGWLWRVEEPWLWRRKWQEEVEDILVLERLAV